MDVTVSRDKICEAIQKFRYVKFAHNGRSLKEGLDCLGFIIMFYREFGITIPNDDGIIIEKDWYKHDPERYIRNIKKLSNRNIDMRSLKPLDLAYFAISRNIITHTGIMLNGYEFAHMTPNRNFRINRLDRQWGRMFRGAVRLIDDYDVV